MKNNALRMEKVSLSYNGHRLFEDFDLEIRKGEFVAIVGASGCGKTSLLNLMAGFLRAGGGKVSKESPSRMVYQLDGLLPWLTVEENILLGLREVPDRAERSSRLRELLELVGLKDFAGHYPHQLSGGMRQKTEIARALGGNAEILLLDEPFGSLDYLTRLRLRTEFMAILQEFSRTVVLVTHDVEEAVQMADRVLLLGESPAKILKEFSIDAGKRRSSRNYSGSLVQSILTEMGLNENPAGTLAAAA